MIRMKEDGSVRYLATVFAITALVTSVDGPSRAGTISQEIRQYAQNIPSKDNVEIYDVYIKGWCDALEREDPRKADKRDILALASILRIDRPGINVCAADYLGVIGPRARPAVPKIQKLYDFLACAKPETYDMPATGVVHEALFSIGVRPVVASCERGRHFPEISSPPDDGIPTQPPPPDPPKGGGG